MKRWLKAFGIFSSAVVIIVATILLLPDRLYQRAAESVTHLLTDRELHIGTLSIKRGLQTVVEMSDISFSNAEWSDQSSMIKVKKLTVSLNLRTLILRIVEISSLSLNGLKLHLERNAQDQSNWQLSEGESGDVRQDRLHIKLIEFSAENNFIEYTDHAGGVQHAIELQSLNFHASTDTRIPVIGARGTVNGFPAVINTLSKTPNSIVSDDEDLSFARLPFNIEASVGEVAITATGDFDTSNGKNGEGGLYIEGVVLKRGLLHVLSSDLLYQLIDAINPSKHQGKQTRLTCSALTFQINNGMLDTPMGFAVDADKFTIYGNAVINLSDESINVEIDSKAKKGSGFSFSLNRLVNLVKIDGHLASPRLSLSHSGVLRLGTTIVAAVVSGGLTILAKALWERQNANSDVCAQVLGK